MKKGNGAASTPIFTITPESISLKKEKVNLLAIFGQNQKSGRSF
jgi:hypothetical protein